MSKKYPPELIDAVYHASKGDGPVSIFIYRPIVLRLMRWINRPISPNKISVVNGVLLVFSSLILALPIIKPYFMIFFNLKLPELPLWLIVLLFTVIYQFSLVLDCLDGAMARYYNLASTYGALLDVIIDIFGDFVLFTVIYLLIWDSLMKYMFLFFFVTKFLFDLLLQALDGRITETFYKKKIYDFKMARAEEAYSFVPQKVMVHGREIKLVIGNRDILALVVTLIVLNILVLKYNPLIAYILMLLYILGWFMGCIVGLMARLKIARLLDKYIQQSDKTRS